MIIDFQNLFRPTYEARSAAAWGVSLVSMTGIALTSDISTSAFLWMGAGSAGMLLWRGSQAKRFGISRQIWRESRSRS